MVKVQEIFMILILNFLNTEKYTIKMILEVHGKKLDLKCDQGEIDHLPQHF